MWILLCSKVAYYQSGKVDHFKQILEEASSEGVFFFFLDSLALPNTIPFSDADAHLEGTKAERIAILNTLAAHFTNLGISTLKESQRMEQFRLAAMLYQRSDKIDSHQSTFIGKGFIFIFSTVPFQNYFDLGVLLLCKNDTDRALSNFENALILDPENIPALLGKVHTLFFAVLFFYLILDFRPVSISPRRNLMTLFPSTSGFCESIHFVPLAFVSVWDFASTDWVAWKKPKQLSTEFCSWYFISTFGCVQQEIDFRTRETLRL